MGTRAEEESCGLMCSTHKLYVTLLKLSPAGLTSVPSFSSTSSQDNENESEEYAASYIDSRGHYVDVMSSMNINVKHVLDIRHLGH